MSKYTEALHHYLTQPPPNYGDRDLHSLTEFLWRIYTELNPIDNDTIQSGFQKLDPYFKTMPTHEANRLFCIICSICSEQERLAFLEGMRVGVLLMDELKTSGQ